MERPKELDFNCRHCAKLIVHGPNVWLQVGSSSVTAANQNAMVPATNAYKLEEKQFQGSGELEDCTLVKLLCGGCKKRIGLRCVRNDSRRKPGFVGRDLFKFEHLQAKVRGSLYDSQFVVVEGNPAIVNETKPLSAAANGSQLTDRSLTLQQPSNLSSLSSLQPRGSEMASPSTLKEGKLQATVAEHERTIESLTTMFGELREEFNAFKRAHTNCVPSTSSVDVQMSGTADSRPHTNGFTMPPPLVNGTPPMRPKLDSPYISDSSMSTSIPSTFNEPSLRHEPGSSSRPSPRSGIYSKISGLRQLDAPLSPKASGTITEDTQQYLRKTVPDYDPKDEDWIPPPASYETPDLQDQPQMGARELPDSYRRSTLGAPVSSATTLPSISHLIHGDSHPPPSITTPPLHSITPVAYGTLPKRRSPTPEWERPDWDPDRHANGYKFGLGNHAPTSRGQGIKRRGISSGTAAAAAQSPTTTHSSLKRQRDSDGYLLLANGKRDGRSVRHARDDLVPVVKPDGRMKHQVVATYSAVDPRSIPGQRDAEGFLLRPNGKRDRRSGKGAILRKDKHDRDVLRNMNNTAIAGTPQSATPESFHTPGNENSVATAWTPANGAGLVPASMPEEPPSSQRTVIKEELPVPDGHRGVMNKIFPHREIQ